MFQRGFEPTETGRGEIVGSADPGEPRRDRGTVAPSRATTLASGPSIDGSVGVDSVGVDSVGAVPEGLPDAVCWDMDGTLVDTEPYWIAEEVRFVEAHGGSWTEAEALQCVGRTLVSVAELLKESSGSELAAGEIADLIIGRVTERVRRDGPPWRPGARELLQELRRVGVPCVLVTMSYQVLAEAVLESLGEGVMEFAITGDEVVHGKPHPEPYLRAAERLGVDPRRCVALEDSPTGLTSALAAGMPTIALPLMVEIDARPGLSRIRDLRGVSLEDLVRVASGEVLERL